MSLNGKVAIVTGSGRGLGLAYAAELARQGASVVVNDVDEGTAASAVASIEAEGGTAVAVVAAVGSTETAEALVAAAVENFGRLDILVTNAGVLRDTVLWKMSDDDFDTVIGVHLRGTFTCVREAAIHLREQGEGGRIICIGSPTGQRGNFGQTNYAAAKAGIVGMVRTWALELKRAGITANAVIPVAATAMTATVPYFAAAVEADAKGERARLLPARPRIRHVRRRRGARRLPGVGCRGRRDRAGDRRRRRPPAAVVAPRARRHGVPRGRVDIRRAHHGLRRRVRRRCRSVGELPPASRRAAAAAASALSRGIRPMTRYEPAIDVDALTAIDLHVHIEVDDHEHSSLPPNSSRPRASTSAPTVPGPTSTVSPRTTGSADGRSRLHRRRRTRLGHRRSPPRRSPGAPRATTTC